MKKVVYEVIWANEEGRDEKAVYDNREDAIRRAKNESRWYSWCNDRNIEVKCFSEYKEAKIKCPLQKIVIEDIEY